MKIDSEVVIQIAKLAHLELEQNEVELFTKQLQEILQYIEQLNEVEESATPFSFTEFLPSQTRPDSVLPSLPVDDVLKNAPEHIQRFFKVPRIIP